MAGKQEIIDGLCPAVAMVKKQLASAGDCHVLCLPIIPGSYLPIFWLQYCKQRKAGSEKPENEAFLHSCFF